MNVRPRILLVEDNEDDRYLTERVLKKAGLETTYNATDGRVAIDYLVGERDFSDRTQYPLPDLILLDLKLPEINGHQVLEWIKTRADLRECPVYILSSSGEARDRSRAEQAHAAGYFVKPLTAQNVEQIQARFGGE
jgi:CheY-like chemotaxis protein